MSTTRERVPSQTADEINRRIWRNTICNVQFYGEHKDQIGQRLHELDEEWDIERAIGANAAAFGFLGIALSITRGRGWLFLPALVTGFLFQHAIQGWCPPVPILRRLGFRTSYEIGEERQALKALRGDYAHAAENVGESLRAAHA